MLTRRSLFAGAAASPLVTSVDLSQAKPLPTSLSTTFCINPWKHRRDGDAVLRADEILFVEFIRCNDRDTDPMGWLNVYSKKGGEVLQTELYKHQKFLPMLCDMKALGISIKVIQVR